ncbi:MAG: hypothetical protein ACLP9L_09770 [Thermoguttaceae bacterium]
MFAFRLCRKAGPAPIAIPVPQSALIRWLSAALLAMACVGQFRAQAQPASPVPDFYQHQAWLPATNANANAPAGMNLWEGWNQADYVANGPLNAALNEAAKNPKAGYCWYTAIVDALYPWTQYKDAKGGTPFANLFGNADITTAGKWVGAANSAILAAKAAGGGGAVSVNNYLNTLNFGPTTSTGGVALCDTSFSVSSSGSVMVQLAGRTEATTFTPSAAIQLAYNNGWTGVVTIKSASPPQPSLWWDTSFHAMAIAGLGTPGQILVADPDSVPINAGNNNGGWWNWSNLNNLISTSAPLANINTEATNSLDAAVTAVNANIYTNAQAAGPPPVPGNGGYTAANLYGSITLSPSSGQQNQITAASNANYGGKTKITSIDVINTLAMRNKFISPPGFVRPQASGFVPATTYQDTFEWSGAIAAGVQQIEIFPVAPLADSNFTFTDPGWTESQITTDPFGGVWSGGGEDLTLTTSGSVLTLGETADTTIDTTTAATQYNVFFQLSNGNWMVQSVGANENAFGDQPDVTSPVPELGTLPLLATGVACLLGCGRRWTKRIA